MRKKAPDTIRRKPKTPPARKVGNVRKKAPDKKCVFAGHGTYKCRARGTTTARATRTVPALDHVPEDVRKQRCCKTCYTYWRYLHEPCVFARHGTYKCRRAQGTTTARATQRVPALDHVPEDVRKQRCCKTCYTYWRYLHEPCVFARHGTYKCRDEAPQQLALTRTVPALDHVPEDVRKQRCCKTCYTYWRYLHEPCVFARHGTYKCRARGTTTARATQRVPTLDHAPTTSQDNVVAFRVITTGRTYKLCKTTNFVLNVRNLVGDVAGVFLYMGIT